MCIVKIMSASLLYFLALFFFDMQVIPDFEPILAIDGYLT